MGRRVGTVEGAQHRIDHKLGVRTITNNMKGGFTNQNTINTPADIAMHVRWIRGRYESWAYGSRPLVPQRKRFDTPAITKGASIVNSKVECVGLTTPMSRTGMTSTAN